MKIGILSFPFIGAIPNFEFTKNKTEKKGLQLRIRNNSKSVQSIEQTTDVISKRLFWIEIHFLEDFKHNISAKKHHFWGRPQKLYFRGKHQIFLHICVKIKTPPNLDCRKLYTSLQMNLVKKLVH